MNILTMISPHKMKLVAYKKETFSNESFFYFKFKKKYTLKSNQVIIKLMDNEYMISLDSKPNQIVVPSLLQFGRRNLLEYSTEILNINQGNIYLRIDEKTKKLKMIVVKVLAT
jgi:hypothetical protein